jgi:hypothetical protein
MRTLVLVLTGTILILSAACSSGPAAPERGTPAFYWSAAKETFTAGDFLKTSDNLDQLLKTDNEFKTRAQPWSLILTSALAHGYMETGDSFEQGARANKTNPLPFRRYTNEERRMARGLALQFDEQFQSFLKSNKDEPVRLAFPFPNGTQASVPLLAKASIGILPAAGEIDDAHRAILQRSVILETSRTVGAADDATKARQMFSAGEVKVPRADFLLAMANSLHDQAMLFGPTKLDEPEKMKMMSEQVLAALKGIPDTQPVKDLSGKIEKEMKAPRPRTM